jgi:pilus assembly protein Flp/PilA
MEKLIRFFKDEEGVTAIEYSLIAALIAVAIIGSVTDVRTAIINVFTTVSGQMNAAAS